MAASHPFQTALQDAAVFANDPANTNIAMMRMRQAGASWVRIDLSWDNVAPQGAVKPPAKPSADKLNHPGSEPLEQRTIEHESGYGGKGGEPPVSSDQRENTGTDGSLRSESNKR